MNSILSVEVDNIREKSKQREFNSPVGNAVK